MYKTFAALLLILYLTLPIVGILPPLNTPSVLINPSNQYELATYTFSFTLEQDITMPATLEIQFPGQYLSTSLSSTNCTVVGLVCSIAYDSGIDTSTQYSITLTNITNPAAGGVGNFQVRTKIGSNIIEESRIFSNAGIRGSVDSFLYIELSTSNGVAGMNASYSLRFKTRQSYPYSVSFEMSLGTSYNISVLQQQYSSIDASQQYSINFGMRNPYSVDAIANLPATLFKGTYLLVRGAVKNPTFSAAPLQCSMLPSSWLGSNSQYKVVDYDFTITALYQALASSELEIIVPEYFARYNTGSPNTLFYYGYDGNVLSFQGDRTFLMSIENSTSTMRYRLRLQNPYIIGTTSPFRLSLRLRNSMYMFDESTCITTISSLAPADLNRPYTVTSTNSFVGSSTTLTFSVPAVPASNNIQFKFSQDWLLTPSSIVATVGGAYTILGTSSPDQWTLAITLTQNITTATTVILSAGITNPITNGSYLVEVIIGSVSYSDMVVVSAPSTPFQSLTVTGNLISLSFNSTGITPGSVSFDFGTGNYLNTAVDCTLNNYAAGCSFITSTVLELTNLTLASGTINQLVISGITRSGSNTYTFRQYRTLPEVGSVEMRQVSTKTVSSTNTIINCGQLSCSYGVALDVVISSCFSVTNPTDLLVATDSFVNSVSSNLFVNAVQKLTSNPLYRYSLLVEDTLPTSMDNLTVSRLIPYISPATSVLHVYVSNSTITNHYTYTLNINQQNNLPTSVVLSSYSKQDVGVIYNFTISPIADTPLGSLVINFPAVYSLNGSAAWATSNFTGNPIPSVESTRVVVNDVTLSAGRHYLVSIFGVFNPNLNKATGFGLTFLQTTPTTIVFAATVTSLTVSFTSQLSKSSLNMSINFYPQNALIKADYSFAIIVPRIVPAKSALELNFPGEFVTLGSPICSLQQFGYSSCSIISNITIRIVLSNGIQPNVPITVNIGNVSNPFQGTTNLFYVSITCNYQVIADGYSQPLHVQQSCETRTLVQWSLSPITVGSQAQYTFSYLPTYDITSQDILFIRFPYEFDSILGPGLTCLFTDALGKQSKATCQRINFMEVQLYIGQYRVFSGTPMTLKIVGVVNVNRPTDVLVIGVKKMAASYYTESAVTLTGMSPWIAASTLTFNSLQSSNLNIRLTGTYTIEFYSPLPITCSTMSVYIVFPNYIYELQLNATVSCSSPQFQAACQISYNNRIQIVPIGIQKIPAGLIQLVLFGLSNPIDQSIVSAYHVEIFDTLNDIVVARTYSNLEFYSMQFVPLGPYIKFNNEQSITMNQGTTFNIPVLVTQPLILQVKARGFGPFAFDPYLLILEPGSSHSLVRISSPKGQTGTFTINWQIHGDLTPLYYTPVKRTIVNIVPVLTSISVVSLQTPLQVPAIGCSTMVQVQLQYPPDTNIVVDVYDNMTTPLYSLQFLRNTTLQMFSLCNRTVSGTLLFQLSGINQPNYQLTTTSLKYTVASTTTALPASVFGLNSTTKTTASFNISLDSVASGMLLLSLNNSLLPPRLNQSNIDQTVMSLLPTSTRTKQIYFQYSTISINMSVVATGLSPNISYQVGLYVMLTNGTFMLLNNLTFWSAVFDPVCQLTFAFSSAIADTDKWAFRQSLSYVLSVAIGTLTINPEYNSQTATKIMIGQQSNSTDESPTPMSLTNNLYIRPQRLQSRVKSLILQQPYVIQLGPITTTPQVNSVYLSSYNINQLTFVVDISAPGVLYGVLVVANSSQPSPTAQQVFLGLDYMNSIPVALVRLNPSQFGPNTLVFSNLQPLQSYNLCVLVGNRDPNPALNSTVVCLEKQTQYPPSHITLQIKAATRLFCFVSVLLLLIL